MKGEDSQANSFFGLPGADIVERGLEDLRVGVYSEQALIVLVASPRLQRLGIEIPQHAVARPYEHQLYALVEERGGSDAHSSYNALLRRVVSFARALERETTALKTRHSESTPT